MSFLANLDSVTDPLTNAGNKRSFDILLDALQNRISAGIKKSKNVQGCIIATDLDLFKPVNDNLGYPVGDAVLVEVVKRFQNMDGGHLVFQVDRVGGDEIYITVTDPRTKRDYLDLLPGGNGIAKLFGRITAAEQKDKRKSSMTFEEYVVQQFGDQIDHIVDDLSVVPETGVYAGQRVKVNVGMTFGIAFFGNEDGLTVKETLTRSQGNLHDKKVVKKEQQRIEHLNKVTGKQDFEALVELANGVESNTPKAVTRLVEAFKALKTISDEDGKISRILVSQESETFKEILAEQNKHGALRYLEFLTTGIQPLNAENLRISDPVDTGRSDASIVPLRSSIALSRNSSLELG